MKCDLSFYSPAKQVDFQFWRVPGRIVYMPGILSEPILTDTVLADVKSLLAKQYSVVVIQIILNYKSQTSISYITSKSVEGVRYVFLNLPSIAFNESNNLISAATNCIINLLLLFKPSMVLANNNNLIIHAAKQASLRLCLSFFDSQVEDLIQAGIPISTNESSQIEQHTNHNRIRVAAIMDEFTYVSFKDTCILLQLTITHFKEELQQFSPELLFIESAWRGKYGAWDRKISNASPELIGAIEWCKDHGIPTMFWNKEDPIHYGTFLNTAKLFDYVFTTDLNCIGNYKKDLGHERVYLLSFACNPVDHNPIEKYHRKQKACFAGSYYVRYPERIKDLDMLLETFSEHSGVDIYDRQYGKEDPNYAFPEKYNSMILGTLNYSQIDLAYKGYRYGINLNSVKYSPTMFARRVYELLASNTLVVSNYSKGVRLQFGDLVISSDAKTEVSARIDRLSADLHYAEKIKLAGLRKVMSEHTYEDRFSYLMSKVFGHTYQTALPVINVVALAETTEDLYRIINIFRLQRYDAKKLYVLLNEQLITENCDSQVNEYFIKGDLANNQCLSLNSSEYIAYIDPLNFYGQHYLIDLAIATKYAQAIIIAKGMNYQSKHDGINGTGLTRREYTYGNTFSYEAAIIPVSELNKLLKAIETKNEKSITVVLTKDRNVFYTDHFNFVKNGYSLIDKIRNIECANIDLSNFDTGTLMANLQGRAETICPALEPKIDYSHQPVLRGSELYSLLNMTSAKGRGIVCTVHGLKLKIDASIDAESPYYIYANDLMPIEALWGDRSGKFYLKTTLSLEISPVFIYFDENETRLSHQIMISNWNQHATIPRNAKYIKLGLRVSGNPGSALVEALVMEHVSENHRFAWMQSSSLLLITPSYPTYDDYYRYAFVHRRVKGYKKSGAKLDVFRFRQAGHLNYYEFDDVDVVSGGSDVLNTILQYSAYSTIAIHALDSSIWAVLSKHIENEKIVIWLHGSEIQSWKRRIFNYIDQEEIDRARINGEKRDQFWKSLFRLKHPNIHFVFVSNYFYQEVMSDLGVSCLSGNIHIIHNPIDTELFHYQKKLPEQRKCILSIRPYASRVYANDLMVKAIITLSSRSFFHELQFLIIGDGVLFDETLEPLKQYKNVEIRKGFLAQGDIAKLYKNYGVFLCPSRMDTQGVSRDEAMATGLVPVTNDVGAIAEFVDTRSGFLCKSEDYEHLANCIEKLYHNPTLFERMSLDAANSVRESRAANDICKKEMTLFE